MTGKQGVRVVYDEPMSDERIIIDPHVAAGKPVVKGTRLSVQFILELLADGWTQAQVLENYPGLVAEDIRACLTYASERLAEEEVFATKG